MNNLAVEGKGREKNGFIVPSLCNSDGFNRNIDGERTKFFIFCFGYLEVELYKKHQSREVQ